MAGIALEIGVDPKLTEQFLLSQPEVFNASVWLSAGQMHAHVTVSDHADWTRSSIQLACMAELGADQTPREVTLVASRRLAA